VFESDGQVRRHAGGYSDWLERHLSLAVTDTPAASAASSAPAERAKPASRKLSYMLQRELDALPDQIEQLETRVGALRETVSDPAFYQRPHADVQQQLAALQGLERELEVAVERWGELEQLAADVAGDGRPSDR
jgi:ATP-binding cassette subfamily F protein uup